MIGVPHDVHFVDLSEALVCPRCDDRDPFSRWLFAFQISRIV